MSIETIALLLWRRLPERLKKYPRGHKEFIFNFSRRMAGEFGLHVGTLYPDFSPEEHELSRKVRPFTMTRPESIYSLCQATRYVVEAGIPGSIVECGVWKGGSMMAVAHTLQSIGNSERDLYLFDTFEGMTEPRDMDITFSGAVASDMIKRHRRIGEGSDWCYAPVEEVRRNMLSTGYRPDMIKLVKGRVENTIPSSAPEAIALLRLDTDWYESTRHELEHLYPRLSHGGVLIIDDYGYWKGSRKATDEYLARNNTQLLMCRIDNTARMAVKP